VCFDETFSPPYNSSRPLYSLIVDPYKSQVKDFGSFPVKRHFAELPLHTSAARGIVAGPGQTIVARVEVLKYVDWFAGRKRVVENGGRHLLFSI